VSFPDWVEGQITAAQRAGEFDGLSGAGKPIPGIEQPQHELQWVADYLRREEIEVAAILPPQLALAKAVEDLPRALAAMPSETRARAAIDELNERIRAAHRAPQHGPPVRVRTVDVDAALVQWRAARATRVAALEAARTPVQPQPAPPRRRWWRRG
jgi:hypothetical protein